MEFKVIGLDFSSSPKKTKPIIIAIGSLKFDKKKSKIKNSFFVSLDDFIELDSLKKFEDFLSGKQNWIGGFDLPFGMPRVLVENYKWPTSWNKFVEYYCLQKRDYLKDCFKSWCDSRPIGKKYAWRLTDVVARSSSAMKWTNPPVAWMMHAGLLKMLDANLIFPAHDYPIPKNKIYELIKTNNKTNFFKIALEAYPALSARKIIKNSYKSDDKGKQDSARLECRKAILSGLINDEVELNLKLSLSRKMSEIILKDARGDFLDSTICMLQASSSILKKNFGLPKDVDPLEGWIICT